MATIKVTAPGGLVGAVTINDMDYVVSLGRNGQFWVERDGSAIGRGESLEAAVADARRELTKDRVKVEVPFLDSAFHERTAIGLHRGMHKVIVRGRGTEYLEPHTTVWKPDMPEAERQRYKQLRTEQDRATTELRVLRQTWEFEIGRAVRGAIEAAATEQVSKAA